MVEGMVRTQEGEGIGKGRSCALAWDDELDSGNLAIRYGRMNSSLEGQRAGSGAEDEEDCTILNSET
jgi:hypothetical protein